MPAHLTTQERARYQPTEEDWQVLLRFLGVEGECFMFMAAYEIRSTISAGPPALRGQDLLAFKHHLTRRYIHLTRDGRCWRYVPARWRGWPPTYAQITPARALQMAFPYDRRALLAACETCPLGLAHPEFVSRQRAGAASCLEVKLPAAA